jgi:hypothetical protein
MRNTVIRTNSATSSCALAVIGTTPHTASMSSEWWLYGQLQLSIQLAPNCFRQATAKLVCVLIQFRIFYLNSAVIL